MPFDTHLIAVRIEAGRYKVIDQTIAEINVGALRRDRLLNDVSEGVAYRDEAAIIRYETFLDYLLPESHLLYKPALKWYSSLPKKTLFVIVHRAEWESGFSD